LKIYYFKVIDFDGMENSKALAEYVSDEKFFLNLDALKQFKSKLPEREYKGWNGEVYPMYQIKECELIE
jgi:hypothetical protein